MTPLQHQHDLMQRAARYENILVEIANEPMVMRLILLQRAQLWADIIEAVSEFSDDISDEELAMEEAAARATDRSEG